MPLYRELSKGEGRREGSAGEGGFLTHLILLRSKFPLGNSFQAISFSCTQNLRVPFFLLMLPPAFVIWTLERTQHRIASPVFHAAACKPPRIQFLQYRPLVQKQMTSQVSRMLSPTWECSSAPGILLPRSEVMFIASRNIRCKTEQKPQPIYMGPWSVNSQQVKGNTSDLYNLLNSQKTETLCVKRNNPLNPNHRSRKLKRNNSKQDKDGTNTGSKAHCWHFTRSVL